MSVFDKAAERNVVVLKRLECLRSVEGNLKWYQFFKKLKASDEFLKELLDWAKVWGKRSEKLKDKIKNL